MSERRHHGCMGRRLGDLEWKREQEVAEKQEEEVKQAIEGLAALLTVAS